MTSPNRKVCLISIDGWGLSDVSKGNAILNAETPVMDSFVTDPNLLHGQLDASGLSVGLPEGVMGNSEVGHLTMGAGRASFQDLVRINAAIKKNRFKDLPALVEAVERVKAGTGRLHLLGLVSDGGVHSHIDHFKVVLAIAKELGVPETWVHFFADGRDTPPTSSPTYVKQLQGYMDTLGYGKIATMTGRYYAMDRDKRWDRIKLAYEGLVAGQGESVTKDTLQDCIKRRHAAGENDEFIKPIIVDKAGCVAEGDTLLFMDFRSDRMREITEAMGVKLPFDTAHPVPKNIQLVTMTKYNSAFKFPMLFPPQSMENVLAEWVSKAKLRQFHTAETEKYAHVTFFFNGGQEKAFDLEDRRLVASPKVATYDLEPKMSQAGVGESVIDAMSKGVYSLVMCNLAAPDMVGHTGVYDAAVLAVQECDKVIGDILKGCRQYGYTLVVTSDHGNAEKMLDDQGNVQTKHSKNFVPLNIAVDPKLQMSLTRTVGGLADVAPTVLDIMGLSCPKEMTGSSMVKVQERSKL